MRVLVVVQTQKMLWVWATSQTIESCLTGVATPSFPGHVGIGAFIPGLHAFNRFVSVLLVDPRLLSAV